MGKGLTILVLAIGRGVLSLRLGTFRLDYEYEIEYEIEYEYDFRISNQ